MRSVLKRPIVVFAVVLSLAAAAGAAGTFAVVSLERPSNSTPFDGALVDIETGVFHSTGALGNVSFPYVRASLNLYSPTSLNPENLVVSVFGSNDSLGKRNGSSVHGWALHYVPNNYPHWTVEWPSSGGGYFYSTCITATFVDPGGAVVGGDLSASGAVAGTIESGALMTVSFPSWYATAAGLTVVLSDTGHPGSLSLAIG